MTIKHAEVTLGCYYRSKDSQGKLYGGPTFYMEKGIVIEKGQKWGWILVIGFAVGMVLQFLGGSQAYSIAESLYETFGFDQIVFVLLYSAFLLYIIWKGVPRIAKVASRLVPFMCVLYLLGGNATEDTATGQQLHATFMQRVDDMGKASKFVLRNIGENTEANAFFNVLTTHIALDLLDLLHRAVRTTNLQKIHGSRDRMAQFLAVSFKNIVIDIELRYRFMPSHCSLICRCLRRNPYD